MRVGKQIHRAWMPGVVGSTGSNSVTPWRRVALGSLSLGQDFGCDGVQQLCDFTR